MTKDQLDKVRQVTGLLIESGEADALVRLVRSDEWQVFEGILERMKDKAAFDSVKLPSDTSGPLLAEKVNNLNGQYLVWSRLFAFKKHIHIILS